MLNALARWNEHMLTVLFLATVSAVAIIATVRTVALDGYRAIPTRRYITLP